MKYFTPIVGGAVCVGGSACAIAVPVTLTAGTGSTGLVVSKCREGGGTESSEIVNFGDLGSRRVCWKLTSQSGDEEDDEEEAASTQESRHEGQLSQVLTSIWNRKNSLVSESTLDSNWKVECNSQWKTEVSESSGNNSKIFGYCGSSGSSNQNSYPFLEITSSGSSSSTPSVSVCFKGQNCFTDSTSGAVPHTFNTKSAHEWKNLSFQKM